MARKKSSVEDGSEKIKKIGLFDHVKHICRIQDPNYFNNLSDTDQKSFKQNHFMILRALSMNPNLLDDISMLYRYFDKIPPAQFYQLLIAVIPQDKNYYPWIKGQKKYKFSNKVIEYIAQRFEISTREAEDLVLILDGTEIGKIELHKLIRGFGLTDKEVDNLLKGKDEEEI